MGKCFKAATFIKKQQVAALSTLAPVPGLKKTGGLLSIADLQLVLRFHGFNREVTVFDPKPWLKP